MRFDILGRTISPRISSIRNVEWRESRTAVSCSCSGPVRWSGAANLRLAAERPSDPAARGRFQHDLVEKFPNVSVIDFHDVVERIRT